MGILYVAAAFLVVPGLLLLFHRLSRPPAGGPTSLPPNAVPPTAVPPTAPVPHPHGADVHPSAGSVADEAERWLRSQA
ncbi:MAG TPA: hypothetical protein VFH58_13090 [Acidimicrobiales bacterium]|nr:hypothetical protein [Acidimicrobiales bacterium]